MSWMVPSRVSVSKSLSQRVRKVLENCCVHSISDVGNSSKRISKIKLKLPIACFIALSKDCPSLPIRIETSDTALRTVKEAWRKTEKIRKRGFFSRHMLVLTQKIRPQPVYLFWSRPEATVKSWKMESYHPYWMFVESTLDKTYVLIKIQCEWTYK